MKYIAPFLLLVALGWNEGTTRLAADDTPAGPFKPTITALKDGQIEDRLTYRKEFATREECETFVVSGDEQFIKLTKEALAVLAARGDDEAHLTCEPVTPKPSI